MKSERKNSKPEEISLLRNAPFVCSWSGGKDSCLALWQAIELGGIPQSLLTMLDEHGRRSRSHGLPLQVLQEQADAMGIPLITAQASWDEYEAAFTAALRAAAHEGARASVFGDIDFEENRAWEEKVSQQAGMQAYVPLWQQSREELLRTFFELGFKATIIAVKDDGLGKRFLGRVLDDDLLVEFEQAGIDLSGEAGEYHTIVTDGPLFNKPLSLRKGEITQHAGVWFLGMQIG
ncbi:MAG: diphthine--ammonia ligase [Anaerolineales bacterium]